jgi:hypothetical protein
MPGDWCRGFEYAWQEPDPDADEGPRLLGSCSGSHAERAGGRDGPLVSQVTQGTAARRAARRIGPLSTGGPSRVALGLRVGDRSAAG